MNISSSTTDQRPAVWLFVLQPVPEETIMPILWGLEEEGIPAELREETSGTAEILAKQAADASPLNVGIGISGNEMEVVLHHRDLRVEAPLFSLGPMDLNPTVLRILGVNAARLFKREPLVFEDRLLIDTDAQNPDQSEQGELEELIARVFKEILE